MTYHHSKKNFPIRIWSIIVIMALLCSTSFGQKFSRLSADVKIGNKELAHPFVGGLNIPQHYNIDLNNDGILDVVMLDREGGVAVPYLRTSNAVGTSNLEFAPSYKCAFEGIREWFVVRDYNQDGIADIFCFPSNNLPGIEVRKGSYVNDRIQFEKVPFNDDPSKPDILLYPSFSGLVNVYVGSNDQPEIIDVDQDGDMDILTFDVGGSWMNYYKNYAIEEGLSVDTFSFLLEDNCWGKFYEQDMSEELLLSTDKDVCAKPFTSGPVVSNRHSGSTVTAFDGDGDGDLDMVIGDLASNNLVYLDNQGENSELSWIKDQDQTYPSYDIPVDVELFNAGFYLDVNNDGKRDFLASPNSTSVIENRNVVWYYNNVGTDEAPVFEYVKEDLFVEDMIDLGSETVPQFADYNQDGLIDIVVGTRGEYISAGSTQARLVLFENVGTTTEPKFELKDDDYANHAQYATTALILSPAFGDVDGDGDIDMMVADNNGDLYYSENIAGAGQTFDFKPAIYKFMGIRPGNKVRVSIMDLDGDGLGDIITGQKKNENNGQGVIGGLTFYKNIGSVGNPLFEGDKYIAPNIVAFGGVNTQVIGFSESYASPALYNYGDDFLLVTGSKSGRVNAYDGIKNNLDGLFEKRFEDWGNVREGELTNLSIADINDDGILDLVVGNTRGGLSLFGTNLTTQGSVPNHELLKNLVLDFYPNPVGEVLHINAKEVDLYSFKLSIYNLEGKLVHQNKYYNQKSVPVAFLQKGMYLLRLESEQGIATRRFVKF